MPTVASSLRLVVLVGFASSAVLVDAGCGTKPGGEGGRGTASEPQTKASTAAEPDEPDEPAEPEPEPTPVGEDGVNPVNQLLVTSTGKDAVATEVALIQFDKSHRAHAFPLVSDMALYEPFDAAWKEISAKEKLTWKHHDESGLVGTDHGPGEHDYIFGVEQALSRTPGLSVGMGSGVGLKAERGGMTVGVVNVVDNAHGRVYVLMPGPDGDALVEAWKGLEGQDRLPMDSHTNTENGREYGTKLVPKGDPEYPWAVWSALEGGHGFLMDAL